MFVEEISEMAFARNLTYFRKKIGFKQSRVAQEVNITPAYYNQLEKGKRTPSLKVALRIAKTLRCSIEDLLTE